VRVDWACIDDVQWPIFKRVFEDLGGQIFDPERVITVVDHYLPASTIDQAETVNELRTFTRAHRLPHGFFTEGVKHQVFIEEGLIRPGDLLVATDSHTPTAGAVGAIGLAVGATEVAAAFVHGTIWLRVPQTIRIVLSGALPPMVYAKDVALAILGREGVRFGNYRVLEFDGPALSRMGLTERMTLANMGTEMGAKATMTAPPAGEPRPLASDPDAIFEREIHVDVGTLVPLVAAPHLPSNVDAVTAFQGVGVDQAFVGSCANATYDDLRVAAGIVSGRRIARSVEMIVTPSSMRAYRRALADGVIDTLLAAGALVTNPGCGACPGLHMGVLGAGQVRISSQNRNFIGRAGHRDARIYLASPAVVAASALTGRITDPREVGVA
jgi:3-isopropylmalate/(R)-2-methylmalate dehydratase large subunit